MTPGMAVVCTAPLLSVYDVYAEKMTRRTGNVKSFNMPPNEMTTSIAPTQKRRAYVLKERAEGQAETRRKIVESTIGLHQEVGPAATQVSEIARRAGVQRATIYNHFPDDGSLLAACSAHWRALHPMPTPESWPTNADPAERLRVALRELYSWYRETRTMTGNVLRDAQTMPALSRILEAGLLRSVDRFAEKLVEPYRTMDKRRRIALVARAAVDYEFWRILAPLGDNDAAALGAGLIELAAAP
jgi:AcrR family transcriptional regulator